MLTANIPHDVFPRGHVSLNGVVGDDVDYGGEEIGFSVLAAEVLEKRGEPLVSESGRQGGGDGTGERSKKERRKRESRKRLLKNRRHGERGLRDL